MTSTAAASPPAHAAARIIRDEIQGLGHRMRQRHPWLAHQDAIGLTVFVAGAAAITAIAVAYACGVIPAVAAIPASAFFMSLLHELEHDLIHRLYFKRSPRIQDLLMAGVWLFRPSTINPWVRRSLHLHHHKASGSESDLEERAITNGEPWGLRRVLMLADGRLAILLRPFAMRKMVGSFVDAQSPSTPEERRAMARSHLLAYLPLGTIHYTLLHGWAFFHLVSFVAAATGHPIAVSAATAKAVEIVDFLVVVWLAPNVLRAFCLHFVSSNVHYHGDVEPQNVVQQAQVWTAWWLAPFQLFCWNFGGTHAIHHFVVRDPFYLRQMIAKDAQAVMRRHGVRFDDLGTFRRGNRWSERAPTAAPAVA
jgi:fatty acid desaturase